ncbi:MAG: MutS-related protein [Owenweeksia sp.]
MKEVYSQRTQLYHERVQKIQRRSMAFSIGRLIAIGLFFLFGYLFLERGDELWVGMAFIAIVTFIALIMKHSELKKRKKRLENLELLNRNELQYLNGDEVDFPDGQEYSDPDHLYSNDLDIFGPHSLFYHLNRTATLKGRARLARSLSYPAQAATILSKQQAIKELATGLDWRHNFIAAGMDVEEDVRMEDKIRQWLESSKQDANSLLLNFTSRIVLATVAISLGLYFAVLPTAAHFNWFMYAFGFNLLLVFSQFRHIKKEYTMLNGIAPSLHMYAELIKAVEERSFESIALKDIQQELTTDKGKASQAIKKLGRLLDGFDQMNNVVALLLTNGLYLYHLHVLNGLYRWKKAYGGHISGWLNAISETDHLVSLANFAGNYRNYSYPEITDSITFEGEGLGHPLIQKEKRVTNSLDLNDFKYVVLTGSNMSGKSTFLKTLGLNLVLARAGAPVCAKRFSTYPFTILTSMKLADSIAREESYFQAEVLRLKEIRKVLETGEICLVLLDEILRGTNSDDKRNGTRLFMERIAGFNARGVIATHDIDIADLAQKQAGTFKAYYFESKVKDDQLLFDYKLRRGICTTPNATELMRAHGII